MFIRVVDALLSGSAANSQKVYVKVMCGDLDVHTSTAKNRSHCTWGDAFAAAGSESSVRFEVLTKSGFVKQDKSIGSVTVDVSTFSPRVLHKRTFQLNSAGPEVTSCTLQVQLARCTTDEPVHGRVVNFVDACQSAGVQLVGEGGGEGVDSEEEADDALALAAAALRPGDYRIQVHIIKVAELRIVNSKEQVDPVVRVEVLGQTRNTKIHPACLSTGGFHSCPAVPMLCCIYMCSSASRSV